MKKISSLFLAALFFCNISHAAVMIQDDGVNEGLVEYINYSTGQDVSVSGSTATVTGGAVGTDGNWTSDGLAVSLDLAPTKFIATASSGDFAATGFTVGTGDVTFANGGKLDGDTANEIRLIENSDTAKIGFSGDDITLDATDGGYRFILTDATDGTVDICANNDSDDCLVIQTSSNVPNIHTNGSANLKITADGGTIDFADENLTTTGTASLGATTATSVIIGDETFSVPTDDTVRIASNDAATIFDVYTPATADEDACLRLSADNSANNGDDWQVCSDGATNSLLLMNDASGSQAAIYTFANTGDITFGGTTPFITVGDADAEDMGFLFDGNAQDYYMGLDDSVDDLIIGLGTSLGTTPIITMTDVGHTTVTGSTDGILTAWGAGTTNSDAYVRLVGDAQADASDSWQLFNDSSAGQLIFGNDSSVAGTYVNLTTFNATGDITMAGTTPALTLGDAGEEDAQVTFDGNAADFAFGLDDSTDSVSLSLGTALGTTEVFRADGTTLTVTDALTVDGVATFTADPLITGTTPLLTIGDGGDEDTGVQINSDTTDYYIASENSVDSLIIGTGSAIGTTPAITVLGQTVTTNSDSNLGDSALDKTTVVGQFYVPYYTDATRPASGLGVGTIIMMHGLTNKDCGVLTTQASTATSICVSDGTDWVAL